MIRSMKPHPPRERKPSVLVSRKFSLADKLKIDDDSSVVNKIVTPRLIENGQDLTPSNLVPIDTDYDSDDELSWIPNLVKGIVSEGEV
jgi:hypothetical protein